MALVACTPDRPTPVTDGTTLALSGTVKEGQVSPVTGQFVLTPWSQGQSTLTASAVNPNTGALTTLATSSVAANGAFSITLPKVDDSLLVAPVASQAPGCTAAEIDITPGLRGISVSLTAKSVAAGSQTESQIAPLSFTLNSTATGGTMTFKSAEYMYANQAGTIRMQQVCENNGVRVNYEADLRLNRGWNVYSGTVTINLAENNSSTLLRVDNSTPPTQWVAVSRSFMPLANSGDAADLQNRAANLMQQVSPLFR